jgi:hypothetical protein
MLWVGTVDVAHSGGWLGKKNQVCGLLVSGSREKKG